MASELSLVLVAADVSPVVATVMSVAGPASRKWSSQKDQTVPAPALPPARWNICQIGSRWGVFQQWAGSVYWLRLFDTWAGANQFVSSAVAKAAVVK